MKLSMLTKMAALALDAHESGDDTAAPELHTFCLTNLEAIAEALSQECARVREIVGGWPVDNFPAALLKTCRAPKIRDAFRDNVAAKRDALVAEHAAAFQATAALEDERYAFDGAALAGLVKAAPNGAELFLGVQGYKPGLVVPVRPLQKLNRIHPLASCRVTMTSPVYGDWRFAVCWGDVGHYKVQRVAFSPDREQIVVQAPSMTDLVSRALEAVAA